MVTRHSIALSVSLCRVSFTVHTTTLFLSSETFESFLCMREVSVTAEIGRREERRAEINRPKGHHHLNSDQEFQIWDKCGNTKSHESVKLHCKPSCKAFQNYKKNKRESRQHENKSCFSPSCLWRKGQKSFHAYLQ